MTTMTTTMMMTNIFFFVGDDVSMGFVSEEERTIPRHYHDSVVALKLKSTTRHRSSRVCKRMQ